jgi:sulfur carrier protein
MEIIINNIKKTVPEEITLKDLLQKELEGNFRGIAVAVEKKIIPREKWDEHRLHDGQHILIIKATQGG